MKKIKLMIVLLFLSTGTVMAQQAKVTSLMSKDLAEIPGREVLMITVEYAPGGVDPIHKPAKFLVVLVKNQGAPVLVPVPK
jgi:hypothetical protein